MGKPREISWSWQSEDNDQRNGYMAVDGRMTITELIEHMKEVAPGVDPADIHVNWGTVTWSRLATDEELADRRARQARQAERRTKWEREMLATLTAKYPNGPHGPAA